MVHSVGGENDQTPAGSSSIEEETLMSLCLWVISLGAVLATLM